MAARAIASGTISFGLVSIPIKVYTATQAKSVRFTMLAGEDKSRVKQQYVSASTGEVVPRDSMVKGYEYARGQFVVMTDDEIKALEKKTDRTIEIEEFVPIAKVDPIYYEKSNLLGPDKGGHKPYRLLHAAMVEAGRVAVGRFATRGREQLVLLRPSGAGLVLHGLYYADEVRSFDDIELDDSVEFREGEVDLAHQLIDRLASDTFDPQKYEDEYRRSVLEAIERKVAGEEIVASPAEEKHEQIVDLVAALKASLVEKRGQAEEKPAGRVRKAPRAKGKGRTTKRKATGS
jgi:DNA end-binding protein Ku